MPDNLATLIPENDERERALAAQGVLISPLARLGAMVEVLIRTDALARLEWEKERKEMLDLAESQLAQAKLTAGLNQPHLSLADIK